MNENTSVPMTDADLDEIEQRAAGASPAPWTSFVEGRDHLGGDDFIRVSDSDDEPDLYLSRAVDQGVVPASVADLDFVAYARQDIPRLLAEVRRLRGTC
jgi:hypothetical protein